MSAHLKLKRSKLSESVYSVKMWMLVITGYADSGVDARVFGEYDMPYLHADAMSQDTDVVAQNLEEYGNVFQYCPSEVSYGYDTAETLFTIPDKMGWTPPNNKIAIIKVDYSYNIMAADKFAELAQQQGYEIVVNETTQFGVVEWGPILSKIEETQPAYVTFWILDPADAARFMIQFHDRFAENGINALVLHAIYPQYPRVFNLGWRICQWFIVDCQCKPCWDRYCRLCTALAS